MKYTSNNIKDECLSSAKSKECHDKTGRAERRSIQCCISGGNPSTLPTLVEALDEIYYKEQRRRRLGESAYSEEYLHPLKVRASTTE